MPSSSSWVASYMCYSLCSWTVLSHFGRRQQAMMQLLCGVLVSWLLVHATQTAAISPAAATTRNSPPAAVAPNPPHLVLLDHDGGVDDFITLLLLLSGSQKAKLIGITILDGDCHADVAANTTMKLLQLLGRPDIPVAVSSLTAVNPFPAAYRSQGLILDVLPMLNRGDPTDLAALKGRQLQQQPGQEFFAQLLLQQTQKVTVVATGPLSNLAYALDRYPEVADRIGMVYWMGGALRVKGNVYQPHTDGSAEWNAYWDPAAMGVVWRSSVPLTLVPLDGTNKVPITPELVYSFGPQAHHLYSSLAGTFYAPVVNWVFSSPGDPYYAWDALTAACMMDPALCQVQTGLHVAAVLSGPAQGGTVLVDQSQPSTGPSTSSGDQKYLHQASAAGLKQAPEHAQGQPQTERVLLGSSADAAASLQAVDAAAVGRISSGGVFSVQGTDVSQQLSAVKRVSAVLDVDAQEFHRYLLRCLQQ